jgi:hypothetical protein
LRALRFDIVVLAFPTPFAAAQPTLGTINGTVTDKYAEWINN